MPTPEAPATARRPRMPLLVKMLILVLFATVVPLVISGIAAVRRGVDAVGATAERNLRLVASLTATRLDQLFTDTLRLQAVIATNQAIIDALSLPPSQRDSAFPRVESRLDRLLAANPDLALAYIADADGICRVSTGPGMVGRDYKATREYMRRALAGEQHISDLAVGITSKEPGVFFAGPICNSDGKVIGAVALKLKGSVIDRICSDVSHTTKSGFAAVLDAENVFISHPEPDKLYHSAGALSPEAAARINPKLQYNIERVESAGLEQIAAALREPTLRGNLHFTEPDGDVCVAGLARMTTRPWTVCVAQLRGEFDRPLQQLAHQQIWAALGVGILAILVASLATYRLLRPIRALRTAALRAAQGDWSVRAEVVSHDELGDLAHTFNDMMPQLQERAHMQDALRLAMEIQQRLLPSAGPIIPGLDINGANIAADETGGDYYDFLDLSAWNNATVAIAIGDVTGHGISAALLMATARALLRSRATPPGSLTSMMADVNERLCDDTPDGRFMTLLYALVDRPNRRIRLVSAGHDPVIVYSPASDSFIELAGEDLPLGVQHHWEFHELSYDLPADAVLFFGTDGIWEAPDANDNQFGKDRLLSIIRAHGQSSSREIKDAVLAAVKKHRGERPQQDDITIVTIRFTTPTEKP